jgi:hypothetical protein
MNDRRKARLKTLGLVALVFILAALFSQYFSVIRMTAKTEYAPASIERLLEGTAAAPFQYRVLVPWIVGMLEGIPWFAHHIRTPKGYCYAIELASTFALFIAMWFYLGLFFKAVRVKAIGMLLLMYVLSITYLVPKGLAFYYVYDVPGVCLFTLCLLFLRQERWLLFYAMFVVATFNRETSCFLAVALLVVNWRDRRGWALLHCSMLALIWLAIKMALASLYARQNLFELTLLSNMWILTSPYELFHSLSSLGLLWLVVLLAWREIRDRFLLRLCLVAPVFLAGMTFVANLNEIRVFGELIPVILPAALAVLSRQEAGGIAETTARDAHAERVPCAQVR